MVKVICYGQEETWKSRKKAIDFYYEAALATAGSAESERYCKIHNDLVFGLKVASDGSEVCRVNSVLRG